MATTPPPTDPDIYYVILDRYASAETLRESFGFDNSRFIDFLESRGFYVASLSQANYPRTSHSVASSLNMEFLDGVGGADQGYAPVYALLQSSAAVRFLQARGYRYVHIGSWWPPTASDRAADVNVTFHGPVSAFPPAWLARTEATQFGKAVGEPLDFGQQEYLRRLFQFREVANARSEPGPTFMFAHILAPHEPFVFDAEGNFVSSSTRGKEDERAAYVDQLQYVNHEAMALVDALLSGPASSRPVVVLQADEGPFSGLGPSTSTRVSLDRLREKFGILNAYYLPGVANRGLSPGITPVNSFRVVFDDYFTAELPLLPDRSFVFQPGQLYRFLDVTEELHP